MVALTGVPASTVDGTVMKMVESIKSARTQETHTSNKHSDTKPIIEAERMVEDKIRVNSRTHGWETRPSVKSVVLISRESCSKHDQCVARLDRTVMRNVVKRITKSTATVASFCGRVRIKSFEEGYVRPEAFRQERGGMTGYR